MRFPFAFVFFFNEYALYTILKAYIGFLSMIIHTQRLSFKLLGRMCPLIQDVNLRKEVFLRNSELGLPGGEPAPRAPGLGSPSRSSATK